MNEESKLRIVVSESLPPNALAMAPQLEPRPGETQREFLQRTAAGTVVVRLAEVERQEREGEDGSAGVE